MQARVGACRIYHTQDLGILACTFARAYVVSYWHYLDRCSIEVQVAGLEAYASCKLQPESGVASV